MKRLTRLCLILPILALAQWVPGCATQNINPTQARAKTGYVDFYSDPASDLSWEVERFDESEQSYKNVFSELSKSQTGILRLALAPGRHRLQVTFLNRVIVEPAEVEVEVQDGKITPVRVTLSDAGTSQVETKDTSRGGTVYGRYGRRTKIGSEESTRYRISAAANPPVAYQVKERMPYGH